MHVHSERRTGAAGATVAKRLAVNLEIAEEERKGEGRNPPENATICFYPLPIDQGTKVKAIFAVGGRGATRYHQWYSVY